MNEYKKYVYINKYGIYYLVTDVIYYTYGPVLIIKGTLIFTTNAYYNTLNNIPIDFAFKHEQIVDQDDDLDVLRSRYWEKFL